VGALFPAQQKCYSENIEIKTPNLKLVIIAAIIAIALLFFANLEQSPMLYLWAVVVSGFALRDGINLYIGYRKNK